VPHGPRAEDFVFRLAEVFHIFVHENRSD
jgi:hypothetical protein